MKKLVLASCMISLGDSSVAQELSSQDLSERIRNSLDNLSAIDDFSIESAIEDWLGLGASTNAVEVDEDPFIDATPMANLMAKFVSEPGEFGFVVTGAGGSVIDVFNANVPIDRSVDGELVILGYQPPEGAAILLKAGSGWDEAREEWLSRPLK